MKFSINKTELQNALSVVQKGVSTRSSLPVLAGVLIDASADALTLQSTDLELSIQCSVPALIEEPGKTVVPGKLFSDIVKSLPDAAVHVNASEGEASINCDKSTFSVKTLNHEDFPGFPTVQPSQSISIPFTMFSRMVRRVSRVVSRDETRAILTGVLIEQEADTLRMVATDSYRLALTESRVNVTDESDGFLAVIGGSFLNDVAGLSVGEDMVTIGVSDNQILVKCDNMIFINRRIEGSYPNYRQLLPDGYNTRATFPTDELSSSVRRAALLSSSTAPIKFNLSPEVNLAMITVNSADVGSVQESIECPVEGEEVEIAFNSSYVSDGLSVVKDENIYFDVQGSLKPGIFRSIPSEDADNTESYLYLIMPVRI